MHILGELRVDEGEAIRLREALSWIKGIGMKNIEFEMDFKGIVDVVVNPSFSLFLSRRIANVEAHHFVRNVCLYLSPYCLAEPSEFVG